MTLTPKKASRDDKALADLLSAAANLNDTMGQLHTGLKTTNAARRLGAESRLIVGGLSGRISNSPGRLAGFAFRETGGITGAVMQLLDGPDINGDLLVPISLSAGESTRDWYLPSGISFTQGLWLQVVSGTIEGNVYLGTSL